MIPSNSMSDNWWCFYCLAEQRTYQNSWMFTSDKSLMSQLVADTLLHFICNFKDRQRFSSVFTYFSLNRFIFSLDTEKRENFFFSQWFTWEVILLELGSVQFLSSSAISDRESNPCHWSLRLEGNFLEIFDSEKASVVMEAENIQNLNFRFRPLKF